MEGRGVSCLFFLSQAAWHPQGSLVLSEWVLEQNNAQGSPSMVLPNQEDQARVTHAPFTLQPFPFPRRLFEQVFQTTVDVLAQAGFLKAGFGSVRANAGFG